MIRKLSRIQVTRPITNPATGAHESAFGAIEGRLHISLDDESGLVELYCPFKDEASCIHLDNVFEIRFAPGERTSPFAEAHTRYKAEKARAEKVAQG
jgi:hypothetical protein